MLYVFIQNYFIEPENTKTLCEYVIIEADSADEANIVGESIGMCFEPEEDHDPYVEYTHWDKATEDYNCYKKLGEFMNEFKYVFKNNSLIRIYFKNNEIHTLTPKMFFDSEYLQ